MKKTELEKYLDTEDGQMNAERFIKALAENRIIVSIPRVSKSGMSRVIHFGEIRVSDDGRGMVWNFDYFFSKFGYRYERDGLRVHGCGMDMIYATLDSIASELRELGYSVGKCINYIMF